MTEENYIDPTEDKAKAIGKELGIEKEEPEFDIQEEDDTGDERIAKTRESADDKHQRVEREKLSNRDKRQLRKQKVNEKFNEKDAIIQSMSERLALFEARQLEVDNRLSGINRAEIEKAYNDTLWGLNQAKQDYANAINEGDGSKSVESLARLSEANDKLKQIQGVYQQLNTAPTKPQHPQSDAVVANKAQAWASENSWYNPNGGDDDSEIAKTLSGKLAQEGYDPRSDSFWDKLDERLEKYIAPEKRTAADDYDDEPALTRPIRKGAPPVAGNSNRGDTQGKKTITLPTSYINTLKANGIWDDIPRRNKIIAAREKILREIR